MTHERNDEPAQDEHAKKHAEDYQRYTGHEPRSLQEFADAQKVAVGWNEQEQRWNDDQVIRPLAPQINRDFSDCGPREGINAASARLVLGSATQRDEIVSAKPNFSFSDALAMLKAGQRVQRAGWNGKGMYLLYIGSGSFIAGNDRKLLDPFIGMWTVGSTFVPWLASQTDILATDWQIV